MTNGFRYLWHQGTHDRRMHSVNSSSAKDKREMSETSSRELSSGEVTLTPGTALKIHGRPVASRSAREFFQCHCGTQVDGSMSQVRTSPRHWCSPAHQSPGAYRYNKRQTSIAAHNLRTCRLRPRRLLHDRNSRRLPTQPLGKKTRKKQENGR